MTVEVVGLSDFEKVLPSDKSKITEMPPSVWWDFVLAVLKRQGGSGVNELNSVSPSKAYRRVFETGSVDCGGGVKAVKCPCHSDAFCFVFEDPRGDVDGFMCSGPAVKQEISKGLFSSDVSYSTKFTPRVSCGYLESGLVKAIYGDSVLDLEPILDVVYRVLRDDAGYEVKSFDW